MMNLKECSDASFTHFKAIAQAKEEPRNTRLLALYGTIAKAFVDYRAICPHLESRQPLALNKDDREALQHCYDSTTTSLSLLKARIKASQPRLVRAVCQYCMINSPETYDHYLPKVDYPEFSVCSYNLVPCCADCNHQRSKAWRNAKGERRHLHLYYDAVDQAEEILFADIHMEKLPSATFRLDMTKVHSKPFYQLLERHFIQLNLLDRYAQAAPSFLSEQHRSISGLGPDMTPARIIEVCRRQLAADIKAWGPHHWKVALLRAVGNTPEFIRFALDTELSVWNEQEAS